MILSCSDQDKSMVFDYIGRDYGKCLYVFIDLKKYSLENENFSLWVQKKGEKICALITEYYGGIQLYSRDLDLDAEEIAEFLKAKNPKIILGIKDVIDRIKEYFPGYEQEIGNVGQLKELKVTPAKDAYSASMEELKEICEILAEDEGIGKPYGFDSLYAQFKERKEDHFGRNFIQRAENGKITCHAGTYAEVEELAVIGGVITAPEFRGRGYSKPTLAAICKELLDEGKDVFSFFYIPSAIAMHYGVGFEKIGDWAKIMRVDH